MDSIKDIQEKANKLIEGAYKLGSKEGLAGASKESTPVEYVDLGLPSGTKWGDRNVGANKPEDYGEYYNWDEAMALPCKVPAIEQLEELSEECIWEWKGKGYRVTGPNGKSIYLPAAGCRRDGSLRYAGSYGYYWSATLYASDPAFARVLYFNSGDHYASGYYRYIGRSVRPAAE